MSTPAPQNPDAVIGIVMGSSSDWETMKQAAEILTEFGIAFEARVVSAHRMPDEMFAYAEAAAGRGLKAIIAGAGDDGLQSPAGGGFGIGEHLVGHAVGRHDARLEGDAELGQNLGRLLHRLPITAGAHHDADDGIRVLGGWGGQGRAPKLRKALNCRSRGSTSSPP